jgi:HAMP domain-containing protein
MRRLELLWCFLGGSLVNVGLLVAARRSPGSVGRLLAMEHTFESGVTVRTGQLLSAVVSGLGVVLFLLLWPSVERRLSRRRGP